MQIDPVVLEGRVVRLEPLTEAHAEALLEVALDPRIWEFTVANIRSAADLRAYIATALQWQREGTAVPFATIERASGRVIGGTRFHNISVPNRRVEIGWTWINPRWWRTAVNSEAKYLMLRHAFETWRCVRVEFKANAANRRSRAAILRLGATEEGTLRRHLRRDDGSFGDSVYFSILDDEWPAVKARLEASLESGAAIG
jgi:RimJ/RimL family protein N-acetyltransferase